jgi:hypothetical protein
MSGQYEFLSYLETRLETISGIDTDHVFIQQPDEIPTLEQCPCIVVLEDRITPSIVATGALAQDIHHFKIYYLYAPYESAMPVAATTAIRAYWKNLRVALFGSLMLTSTANNQDFDGDISGIDQPIQFRDKWFWGLIVPWSILEQVSVAVTP